ncbi:MAG TPA: hypothetical protein VMX74_11330 [Pirellulales bacterium]|nr:hypothetical protein [Pirellulales bacterium]
MNTKALEREILATEKYGAKMIWLAKMNGLPLRQVVRLVKREIVFGNSHRFK